MAVKRIRKRLSLDCTADTIDEQSLDISIPDGSVIEIVSCQVLLERGTIGTSSKLLTGGVAIAAKTTSLSVFGSVQQEAETAIIGMAPLFDYYDEVGGKDACSQFLNLGPSPYTLDPRVLIGIQATLAASPDYRAIFVVDYDMVKLTQQIAVDLAGR